MLGTDLVGACTRNNIRCKACDLPDFDITDPAQLRDVVQASETIVNCAAYTNVDKAESEPDLAYKINAEAVGNLGTIAAEQNKFVFHISTDFVFDGTKDSPYSETDSPNPISTYGRTKLAGEKLLQQSDCSHCIIRVQWTYGKAGNNFVKKLISRAQQDGKVKVVDDQTGSPTATTEVAVALCELLPQKPQGLFHFAAAGYVSRFDMAKFIFDDLNMPIDLIPCKTSDFKSPAARPLNSRFDCSKIQSLLDEPIKFWQPTLKNFLEQL